MSEVAKSQTKTIVSKLDGVKNISSIQYNKQGNRYHLRLQIRVGVQHLFGGQTAVTPKLHKEMSIEECLYFRDSIRVELEKEIERRKALRAIGRTCPETRFSSPLMETLKSRVLELKTQEQEVSNPPRRLVAIDVKHIVDAWQLLRYQEFQDQLKAMKASGQTIEPGPILDELKNALVVAKTARINGDITSIKGQVIKFLESNNFHYSKDCEVFQQLCLSLLEVEAPAIHLQIDFLDGKDVQFSDASRKLQHHKFISQEYLSHWLKLTTAEPQTRGEAKFVVGLFVQYCQEKYGRELALQEMNREISSEFRWWLQNGLDSGHKCPKPRAIGTVKKYLGLLSAICHAHPNAYKSLDPVFSVFNGLITKKQAQEVAVKSNLRELNQSEAGTLLSNEVGLQLLSAKDPILNTLAYAIDLIALTGMRREEAARITGQDVSFDGETWFIKVLNLTAQEDPHGVRRSTKNKKDRTVVISDDVLPESLRQRLNTVMGDRYTHLLDNLKFNNKGKRGAQLGRRFQSLCKQLGVYRPGVCLYGLRHLFASLSNNSGIAPIMRDAQLGHIKGVENAYGYGGGISVHTLAQSMASFTVCIESLPDTHRDAVIKRSQTSPVHSAIDIGLAA